MARTQGRALRALPLLVVALAFPAPALAGTAGAGLTGPVYAAADLESNNLLVSGLASGKFEFQDTANVIAQGACTSVLAGHGADCSQRSGCPRARSAASP